MPVAFVSEGTGYWRTCFLIASLFQLGVRVHACLATVGNGTWLSLIRTDTVE